MKRARAALAATALAVLGGVAWPSDLADDPDAARVEEMIRKDDWPAARAIWKRRAADAAHDVGRRWADLARFMAPGDEPAWKRQSRGARRVVVLATLLDRDALALDACRIARERAEADTLQGFGGRDAAWASALTLVGAGRPAEAAPHFARLVEDPGFTGMSKAALAEAARLSAAPADEVAGRIALARLLSAVESRSDGALPVRAANLLLRRTLASRPLPERTAELCGAAFRAAFLARDASDLRFALRSAQVADADLASHVAEAALQWTRDGDDPFDGAVAEAAADVALPPRAAEALARAATRWTPAVAERLLRRAAAFRDEPEKRERPTTVELRDAIAASQARKTLALLSMRRGCDDEAIAFWESVRSWSNCGNCAYAETSARNDQIDARRLALGRADVFAENRDAGGYAVERKWLRTLAASALGRLDEWIAEAPAHADGVFALERLRRAGDVEGLIGEVLYGRPIDEKHLTPVAREAFGAPEASPGWRVEKALSLLREFDGREVAPLVRRFEALPIEPPPETPVEPRRSKRAWVVAALANSKSPQAAEALSAWIEEARAGEDVGVSESALLDALARQRDDLVWLYD